MAKVVHNKEETKEERKICGVIMPIAEHPEYKPSHWVDVLSIITETLEDTDFEVNLVSDDIAIGLIHERIVNNIYTNEIVICDVSSKNPNVMFELGMRLAFDKPTIIIKDERTGYSFDTGVIEHLNYPSDLRFGEIKIFKEKLKQKVLATYQKSIDEQNYSPFLKSFGKTIVPANIQQSEISESKYIISRLEDLGKEVKMMRIDNRNSFTHHNEKVIDNIDKSLELVLKNFIEIQTNTKYAFIPQNISAKIVFSDFMDYTIQNGKKYSPAAVLNHFHKNYPNIIFS